MPFPPLTYRWTSSLILALLALLVFASGCVEDDFDAVEEPPLEEPTEQPPAEEPDEEPVPVDPTEHSAEIGLGGGVLQLTGVRLVVPPGALNSPTTLTLRKLERHPGERYKTNSALYSFSPEGLEFELPAIVYLEVGNAPTLASVYWSEREGEGYVALRSEQRGGWLRAEVEHFSEGFSGVPILDFEDLTFVNEVDPCASQTELLSYDDFSASTSFSTALPGEVCLFAYEDPEIGSGFVIDDDVLFGPQDDDEMRKRKRLLPGAHVLGVTIANLSVPPRGDLRFSAYDLDETLDDKHAILGVLDPIGSFDTVLPPGSITFYTTVRHLGSSGTYRYDYRWQVADEDNLTIQHEIIDSATVPGGPLWKALPASWDGMIDSGGAPKPLSDGVYLFALRVDLVNDATNEVIAQVQSPARKMFYGGEESPSEIAEVEHRLTATGLLLEHAMPSNEAMSELSTFTLNWVNYLRSIATSYLSLASAHYDILVALPVTAPQTVIDLHLRMAEYRRTQALEQMRLAGIAINSFLLPRNGNAYYVPRYVVPYEAFARSRRVHADDVAEKIDDFGVGEEPVGYLADVESAIESGDMVVLGKRHTVQSVVLTEFLIVDEALEDLGDGVVLGRGLRVVSGTPILFEQAELLLDGLVYDQALNTNFSPKLLMTHGGVGFAGAIFPSGVMPPIPGGLDSCNGCDCCITMCGQAPIDGLAPVFEMEHSLRDFMYCPSQFQSLSPVDLIGTPKMTRLGDMAQWGFTGNPAFALHRALDFTGHDRVLAGNEPADCGPGQPPPGVLEPWCPQVCGGMEDACRRPYPDTETRPSKFGTSGVSDPETCQELSGRVFGPGGCTSLDDCSIPADSAAVVAKNPLLGQELIDWGVAGTFVSPACLRSYFGDANSQCDLEAPETGAHWFGWLCASDPDQPACELAARTLGSTFCIDGGDNTCFRCDAEGRCHVIGEISGTILSKRKLSAQGVTVASDFVITVDFYYDKHPIYDMAKYGLKIEISWVETAKDTRAGGPAGASTAATNPDGPDPGGGDPDNDGGATSTGTGTGTGTGGDDDGGDPNHHHYDPGWGGGPDPGNGGGSDPDNSSSQAGAGDDAFGDPIAFEDGQLRHHEADLGLPPGGITLELVRAHNATLRDSSLGNRWMHTFEERIEIIDPRHRNAEWPVFCHALQPLTTCLYHHRGDGTGALYILDPARPTNTFVPEYGAAGVFRIIDIENPEAQDHPFTRYVHRSQAGLLTEFDERGHIVGKTTMEGNRADYLYDTQGRLETVLDDQGHGFRFEYGLWDLLIAVEDVVPTNVDGRRVEYCYDLHVMPSWGDFHQNETAVRAAIGFDSPMPGCYRLVEGNPAKEELKAIEECHHEGASNISSCVDGKLAALMQNGDPSGVGFHMAHISAAHRPFLRALADLREVRVIPVGTPFATGSNPACYSPDVQVTRYTYSHVPYERDFHIKIGEHPGLISGNLGLPGGCFQYDGFGVIAMERDLEAVRSSIVRVERLVPPAERLDGAFPVSTGALLCDVSCDSQQWLVELENQYEWLDLYSEEIGQIIAQRWGTDTHPSGTPSSCSLPPQPSGLQDPVAALTIPGMFLERISDYDWRNPAGPVAMRALVAPYIATLSTVDGQPMATFAGESCDKLRAKAPDFPNTTLVGELRAIINPTPVIEEGLEDLRDILLGYGGLRAGTMRQVCEYVVEVDRGGRQHIYALNMDGRVIAEVMPYNGFGTVRRYNRDGYLVESITQPQHGGHALVYEYDESDSNPLARGNLLVERVVPRSGGGSLPSAFSNLVGLPQVDELVRSYTYEPIANRLWSATRHGPAPGDDLTTTYAYSYQESSQARAMVSGWSSITGLPLYDSIPIFTADLNGDGTTYDPRPLMVHATLPAHEAFGSTLENVTVSYQYDGFGAPTRILNSAGHFIEYEYLPRIDVNDAEQVTKPLIGSDPPVPSLQLTSADPMLSGGPLLRTTETTNVAVAAGFFTNEPNAFITVTDYTYGGPGRRLSQVDSYGSTGLQSTWTYDGHRRIDQVSESQTRNSVTSELVVDLTYDNANRLVFAEVDGSDIPPTAYRVYRGASGAIHGLCQELQAGGCSNALTTEVTQRAGGATDALLTTIERDALERTTKVVSPELRAVTLGYHVWGPIQSIIESGSSLSLSTAIELDDFGQTRRISRSGGGEVLEAHYAYDGIGRPFAVRSPNGQQVDVLRDVFGDLVRLRSVGSDGVGQQIVDIERGPANLVESLEHTWWRPSGQLLPTFSTSTTSIVRDENGRPWCVSSDNGLSQFSWYASDGSVAWQQVRSIDDPLERCNSSGGDHLASLVRLVEPRVRVRELRDFGDGAYGSATNLTLDATGRVLSMAQTRDIHIATANYYYDVLGRLVSTTDTWGTGTMLEYDTAGRLKERVQNEVRGASSPNDLVTSFEYDRDGLLKKITDPAGQQTLRSWDGLGRLVSETRPMATGSRTFNFGYDAVSRLDEVWSGSDVWALSYYANTTQPYQLTTPTSTSTFAWAPNGALSTATRTDSDGLGTLAVTTTRTSDSRGAPLKEITTLGNGAFAYDVRWAYDAVGRLEEIRVTDTAQSLPLVEYDFARDGVLMNEIVGSLDSTAAYRLDLTHTGPQPTRRELFFDAGGNFPTAPQLTRDLGLDDFGRASKLAFVLGEVGVGDELGRHTQRYGKDNKVLMSLRGWTDALSGDLTHAQMRVPEYDGRGRVVGLRSAVSSSATDIAAWEAAIDPQTSFVTDLQSVSPGGMQAYTASLAGQWSDYSHTSLGALVSEEVDAGGTPWMAWQATGVVDTSTPSSIASDYGSTGSMTWDALGRLASTDDRTFSWSGSDELRRVVYDDGTTMRTETRTYDAFGRAVRIERDGVVVDRIHAGPTVLREVSPCADRIWWPSEALDQPAAYTLRWESSCLDTDTDFPEQLAAVDLSALTWAAHETALVAATGVTFFVLQDLRGDVVGLTDATGQLLETYDYDLFGARTVGDGSAVTQCTSTLAEACGSQYGNPLGYTGRPLSTVSGLYDMRARHYDPHLRQWTARDPLGYVDGFDVWGYVGGDPLNFVDPYGTFATSPKRNGPETQSGHTTGTEAGDNGGGDGAWGRRKGPARRSGGQQPPAQGGGLGFLRPQAGLDGTARLTKKQRKEYNERRSRIYNAGGEFGEEARGEATRIKEAFPPGTTTQAQIPELEQALCQAELSFGVGECKGADPDEPMRRAMAGVEYACEGGACHEDAAQRAADTGGHHIMVLPPTGGSSIVTQSGAKWADHSLVLDPATGAVWDPTYDQTYESQDDWTKQVVDVKATGGAPRFFPATTAP